MPDVLVPSDESVPPAQPIISTVLVTETIYDESGKKRPVEDLFVKIYKSIRKSGLFKQASGNDLKVLIYIATYIGDNLTAFPTEERIAEDCNLCLDTVRASVAHLRDMAAIDVFKARNPRGRFLHNVYSFARNINFGFGTSRGGAPGGKKSAMVADPDGTTAEKTTHDKTIHDEIPYNEEPCSMKSHSSKKKKRERAAPQPAESAGPPPDAPTAQAQALAAQSNGAVAPYVEAFLRGYGLVAADVPKAEMAKVQAACLAFMAIESKPTAEQLERCTAWKLAVFTQKANWPGSPSMAVDWITKDYANWRRLKEPTPESVAQQSSRPPRAPARPGRAVPAPQPRHAPGAKLEDVYDVPAGWPGRRQAP
jgi:hypothetical protein